MTEGRRCGSGKGGRDRGSRRGHGRGLRVRQGQGTPGRCDPAQSLGEPDPGLDADLDSDHHYVQPCASGVRQIEQVGEGVLSWERVSMTVGSSSMRGGVEAGQGVVGGWSGVSWPSSLLGQGVCACMCVGTRPDKTVFPSSRKPHPQTTEGQVGPGVNKHPVKCNYAVRPPGRPGQLGLGHLSFCLSLSPVYACSQNHAHTYRQTHRNRDPNPRNQSPKEVTQAPRLHSKQPTPRITPSALDAANAVRCVIRSSDRLPPREEVLSSAFYR